MNKLFDALETCLQEIENGADLETVLARYPELAAELRPILQTAIKARTMAAAEPSAEAMRRGRARVMQHAAELREAKSAPRRVIPIFQRLSMSFALLLLFLTSSLGILSASASALPGESLYPVKRGWESVRLFFIFDREARDLLANEFENERLHEIDELLAEGRHETIQFAGVFMQVNGVTYVSGLQVIFPPSMQMPENGTSMIVSGRTNAQGFIEISGIDMLPSGSVVPVGKPIEMEVEDKESHTASDSSSDDVTSVTPPPYYEVKGTLQSISAGALKVGTMTVYLDDAKVKGQLCVGMTVEVKGYYAEDGRFIVTEIEGKGSCSETQTNPPGSNSNDSGDNENSGGHNSNENSGDHNSNEDSNDNSGDDSDKGDNSGNDDSQNDDDNDDDNTNEGGGSDDD